MARRLLTSNSRTALQRSGRTGRRQISAEAMYQNLTSIPVKNAAVRQVCRGLSTEMAGSGASLEKRDRIASDTGSSGCPFGFSSTATKSHPKLNRTPTLPFFGSLVHQYSGAPKFDLSNLHNYSVEMRRRFGEWYSFGIPGFGQGLHGTIYATIDPEEFMKVVRGEGARPSGVVEQIWTVREAMKESGSSLLSADGKNYGLFGDGENWKRQRTFLQTGMLDPRTARGYVPGIAKAAQLASRGAPGMASDLNTYLSYCSFDMFTSFMLGAFTRTADSSVPPEKNEENVRFCNATVEYFELSTMVIRSPYENLMHKFGLRTKDREQLLNLWSVVQEVGKRKIQDFLERRDRNELSATEQASYLANAMGRFEAQEEDDDGYVSKDEVVDLCLIALFVAIDTTNSVSSWNLVHLALNPRVQEKLYEELTAATAKTDGEITAKVLERSNTPYLHAVLRETHRLTPPFPNAMVKTNSQREVEVHGTTFPKGTMFALDSVGFDSDYVGVDAKEFRPERWSEEETEGRRGTPAAAIDHALHRDPFGAGARRCPGSRIATNEIMCLLASLVLDYEITSPEASALDEIQQVSAPFIQPVIPRLIFKPRE